jgi:carbon storage regulator CsrA
MEATMLILSRRAGERFVINTPHGDIWITVVEVDRKARNGIEAPKEYSIYREELLGRIERERSAE